MQEASPAAFKHQGEPFMRLCVLMIWLGLACAAAAQEQKVSVQKYSLPKYPPIAKAARIQGNVKIQLQLTASGEIKSATVVSGNQLLKDSASDAIKQWRFHCDNCKYGEAFEHTITFQFYLRGGTLVDKCEDESSLQELRLPDFVTIYEAACLVHTMPEQPSGSVNPRRTFWQWLLRKKPKRYYIM